MIERLETRIERFLRSGEGDFDGLALELFAYQYERNLPYQAFCRAQDRSPSSVRHWSEIPAVSVSAFKSAELATFPTGRAAAVFHSSATTNQIPSHHFLRTLKYYEASLRWGFQRGFVPDEVGMPLALLVPSSAEAPYSSLSWMLEVVKRKWGAPGSAYFIQRGVLEDDRLNSWLTGAVCAAKPVALLGTTLAFLKFYDRCQASGKAFKLPYGSRLMDTGGMKTQTRIVSREEFLNLTQKFLNIPEAQCVNEYGMCELSSQFYARGRSNVFSGPPWVRVQAVSAENAQPVPTGSSGLLRYFDLANVDSVLALQTDDVGTLVPGGFAFQGRASGAEDKGCSLSAEALLSPKS